MYVNTCRNKKVIKIKKKKRKKKKKTTKLYGSNEQENVEKRATLRNSYGNQAYQYSFQRYFIRLLEAL